MRVMPWLLIHGVPVLEIFQVMQRLLTIEDPDVLRLRRSKTAHRPAQVNEVRFDWSLQRVHPDLVRQVVRLASIARAASGDDVGPVVGAAT